LLDPFGTLKSYNVFLKDAHPEDDGLALGHQAFFNEIV
jgi:hypothetical protein